MLCTGNKREFCGKAALFSLRSFGDFHFTEKWTTIKGSIRNKLGCWIKNTQSDQWGFKGTLQIMILDEGE
jgi:hypothetical protein